MSIWAKSAASRSTWAARSSNTGSTRISSSTSCRAAARASPSRHPKASASSPARASTRCRERRPRHHGPSAHRRRARPRGLSLLPRRYTISSATMVGVMRRADDTRSGPACRPTKLTLLTLAALQFERLLVASDRRRMAGAVDADELQRHLITLVDEDLARLQDIDRDLPAPGLIRLLQHVALAIRQRRRQGTASFSTFAPPLGSTAVTTMWRLAAMAGLTASHAGHSRGRQPKRRDVVWEALRASPLPRGPIVAANDDNIVISNWKMQ